MSLFWNKMRVFNFSTFDGLYRENKGGKWKQIPPLPAIEKVLKVQNQTWPA